MYNQWVVLPTTPFCCLVEVSSSRVEKDLSSLFWRVFFNWKLDFTVRNWRSFPSRIFTTLGFLPTDTYSPCYYINPSFDLGPQSSWTWHMVCLPIFSSSFVGPPNTLILFFVPYLTPLSWVLYFCDFFYSIKENVFTINIWSVKRIIDYKWFL